MEHGEVTPAESDGFNEWDNSIAEEQQSGVTIPEVPSDHDKEEKIEARIATGILFSVIAAGAIHSWNKHRKKE